MRIELNSMKDVLDFLSLFKDDKKEQAKEAIRASIVEEQEDDSTSTESDYVTEENKISTSKKTETKPTKKTKAKAKKEKEPETETRQELEVDEGTDIKQDCRMLVRQCLANNMRSKVLECMAQVDVTSISTASDSQLIRLKEKLEEVLS